MPLPTIGRRVVGVDVGGGRKAEAALNGGTQIGRDLAEEVGGDDDIEAFGCHDHPRGERIDMIARDLDIRVFDGELLGGLVPEEHGVFLRIGLGDGSELAVPYPRLLEAEGDDALDALAGEDRSLDCNLIVHALMNTSAGG